MYSNIGLSFRWTLPLNSLLKQFTLKRKRHSVCIRIQFSSNIPEKRGTFTIFCAHIYLAFAMVTTAKKGWGMIIHKKENKSGVQPQERKKDCVQPKEKMPVFSHKKGKSLWPAMMPSTKSRKLVVSCKQRTKGFGPATKEFRVSVQPQERTIARKKKRLVASHNKEQ